MIDTETQQAIRGAVTDPLFSVFTFFVGALIGHRLALWRDRRREINTAAAPWRAYLIAQVNRPSVQRARPSAFDRSELLARVGFVRRMLIRAAWQSYCQQCDASRQQDALGESSYANPARVAQAAQRCLRWVKIW